MKNRRSKTRAFYVDLDAERAEKLEKILAEKKKTKKQWLKEKIDEEVGK